MTAAERLDSIEAHIAWAHEEVDALCAGKRWTMYVPARPGVDSDLVLAEGLSDGEQAVAALRAALAVHAPYTFAPTQASVRTVCSECSDERDVIYPCPTIRAITAALDGA